MREMLTLAPGILTLTFVQPEGTRTDAVIRPLVPSDATGHVTLMFEPGNPGGCLTRPGEICIIRCDRESRLIIDISSASGNGKPTGGIEIDYLARHRPAPEDRSDALLRLQDGRICPLRLGEESPALQGPITGLCLSPRQDGLRLQLQDMISGRLVAPGEWLLGAKDQEPLADLRIWCDPQDRAQGLRVTAEFARAGRIEAEGTMLRLRGHGSDDALIRIGLALRAGADPGDTGLSIAQELRAGHMFKVYSKFQMSRNATQNC